MKSSTKCFAVLLGLLMLTQPTLASEGQQPKVRIGGDDRELSDTTQYPYTATGRITFENDSGSRYVCTGSLVGRRVVLTNGHCLYSKAHKKYYKNHHFWAGYNGFKGITKEATAVTAIYVPAAYRLGVPGIDWGLMVLSEPVGDLTGWYGVKPFENEYFNDKEFFVTGYGTNWSEAPFSSRFQATNKTGCHAYENVLMTNSIFHDCDSGQGSSGSPFFGWWDGKPYIVAVHHGGWGPHNDERMQSCDDMEVGTCGNLATKANHFLKLVNQYNQENDQ